MNGSAAERTTKNEKPCPARLLVRIRTDPKFRYVIKSFLQSITNHLSQDHIMKVPKFIIYMVENHLER